MFKILATTDVHGNILARNFVTSGVSTKGLSRFSTYLNAEREKNNVIYIDNGDINQGTPLTTYSNYNVNYNVSSKALNYLKCDYFNIGNHDFNYGSDFLGRYVSEIDGKCITSNILYKGKNLGKTQVFEIDGKKIGLVGVVTDYIENWENPKNLEDLEILEVFKTVKENVKSIRGKVDYVVVVYHGGFERDLETGVPTENLTGENVGYKICDEIEEIDLLISGHQHRSFVGKIKDTIIAQCADGCLEFMEISFDEKIEAKIVKTESFEIDEKLERLFDAELEDTEKWLDIEIGQCNMEMYIKDFKEAQLTKHPITSFINKIQMEVTGADISACCLFEVMPGFGKKLKYRDIILNYPFPNTLVVKEMTGNDILEYLQQLSEYWIVENEKIEINPKFLYPKRELYNYDFLDGIEYTMNISKSGKNYISDVKISGVEIDKDRKYKLVLNNYRSTGGGNFAMFPKLKTLAEDTRDIADVLIEYVKENKYIEIEHKDNIKLKIVD